MTREYQFFDNYFLLGFFLLIAKFKSSYEIKLTENSLTVKRNGMVTANIDFPKIKSYQRNSQLVTLHMTDNAIFNLKLKKLNENDYQYLINFIKKNFKKSAPNIQNHIILVDQDIKQDKPTTPIVVALTDDNFENNETVSLTNAVLTDEEFRKSELIASFNTDSTKKSFTGNHSITRLDAGFADIITYSAYITLLLSYITYSLYIGNVYIPDVHVANYTFKFLTYFLWICFPIILFKSKKPFLKISIILLCTFTVLHWWRLDISINDLKHQEGCMVSEKSERDLRYYFSNGENINAYIWKVPTEFRYKEEYLNNCFMVEYYEFLGGRYIYSAKPIKK
jgi:hypothetical protein